MEPNLSAWGTAFGNSWGDAWGTLESLVTDPVPDSIKWGFGDVVITEKSVKTRQQRQNEQLLMTLLT
jgi:hypothetical protein